MFLGDLPILRLNDHPPRSENPTLKSEWRRGSQTLKAEVMVRVIITIMIIIIITVVVVVVLVFSSSKFHQNPLTTIGVGAQSTLVASGRHFARNNMHEKSTKCPNFT